MRRIAARDARVETRRIRFLGDLRDLLPCRYLTLRAVRARDLLKGGGAAILADGGKALFFVGPDEAAALTSRPIPGLRLLETRPLPSGPRSMLAILGAADGR